MPSLSAVIAGQAFERAQGSRRERSTGARVERPPLRRPVSRPPGSADEVIALQRLVGNRATAAALATGGSPTEGRRGPVVQRYPQTALSMPVDWARTTASVFHPPEGLSGGIYILTTNEQNPPINRVVVKPVYGEERGETGETLKAGDEMVRMMGLNSPQSRVVQTGTQEYSQLLSLMRPHQPPPPRTAPPPDELAKWHDVSEAGSFVVMGEVPNAASVPSMAKKAGTDEQVRKDLHATIFSTKFLAELGMLAIADLLMGNTDRLVSGGANYGNIMISMQPQGGELFAIDSGAQLRMQTATSTLLKQGTTETKSWQLAAAHDFSNPLAIVASFFQSVISKVEAAAKAGGDQTGEAVRAFNETLQREKERIDQDFMSGWNRGLRDVTELITTEEGKERLKAQTGKYKGTKGERSLRYSTLKTHALYLKGRGEGKSHQEAITDPAAYYAYKQTVDLGAGSLQLPAAPVSPRYRAGMEKAEFALPEGVPRSPFLAAKGLPSGPDQADSVLAAAKRIEEAGAVLGAKRRGLFKKRTTVRNRTQVANFTADVYRQVAGSVILRRTEQAFTTVTTNADAILNGHLSPGQLEKVMPIIEASISLRPRLRELNAAYVTALRAASANAARLKHLPPSVSAQAESAAADAERRDKANLTSPDDATLRATVDAMRTFAQTKK